MNRRSFIGSLAAASAVLGTRPRTAIAETQGVPRARNVVLVHGLFADGSCWSEVIARLQLKGINVTSVQNPLTTLKDGVAAARRAIARQDGPTVLVGHSFSGMIVTEVGVDPSVSALVYVAARAPDVGEDYAALATRFPMLPASAGIIWSDDWGQLSDAAFLSKRDSAYLATANASGLPTVQHRGGPVGFIRRVDDQTIGFADYTGKRHYISYGNLAENAKACLFLMDYENRRRLKIWGEARISNDAEVLALLTPERYAGIARQALLFRVQAWDDNCSSHIPIKIDAVRVQERIAALQTRIMQLERENVALLEGRRLADARECAARIVGRSS